MIHDGIVVCVGKLVVHCGHYESCCLTLLPFEASVCIWKHYVSKRRLLFVGTCNTTASLATRLCQQVLVPSTCPAGQNWQPWKNYQLLSVRLSCISIDTFIVGLKVARFAACCITVNEIDRNRKGILHCLMNIGNTSLQVIDKSLTKTQGCLQSLGVSRTLIHNS